MTSPALTNLANDELVAVSWIGSIPGFSTGMVATTLPADETKWAETGFVTVSVVGGNPDSYLPVNRPVMQVDCWAVKIGDAHPPWGIAANIANAIKYAAWDRRGFPRVLTLTAGPVTFPPAVVQGVYLATAFRRAYGDQGNYAHYQADLALSWITVNDRLP